MSFFSRFFQWLPSPMRNLRQRLNIELEWQEFKHHIRPHKAKIYIVLIVSTYPLYAPYAIRFKDYASHKLTHVVNNLLSEEKAPFQITDNFAKNLLGSIFSDANIKHEGLEFVNSIIQEDKFVSDILQLLLSALKSSDFLYKFQQEAKSLQGTGKRLVIDLVEDKDVQVALKNTIVSIVSSQEVKKSLIKLIQDAFSSEESVHTIVELLKKGISNEEVKQALSGSINFSVQELLKDEETMNQLKIFIFFLLRKFEHDDQIKSMMDILFAKGLGLTKKKKENDLQKLLKSMDQKRPSRDQASL